MKANQQHDDFIMLPKNDFAFKMLFGNRIKGGIGNGHREDEIYQRAYQQLDVLSMDDATRRQYEAREAWLKDEARMEGETKADIASALAFLDIADDATIATKLSLPLAIVKRLRVGEDVAKITEEVLA